MHVSEITSWHRTAYISWCFDIYTHTPAVNGPESVFSILEEMRVAQTASRALSLNLTMDLPPDYTPLSLAEVFYMATMGGAKGTYLPTECYAPYTTWAEWYSGLLCMHLYLALLWYTNQRNKTKRGNLGTRLGVTIIKTFMSEGCIVNLSLKFISNCTANQITGYCFWALGPLYCQLWTGPYHYYRSSISWDGGLTKGDHLLYLELGCICDSLKHKYLSHV